MLALINNEKSLFSFIKKIKESELIQTTRCNGLINGCCDGEYKIECKKLDGTVVAQYQCKLARSRGRMNRAIPVKGSVRNMYVEDSLFKQYMD